ncbi:RNA polymerase sigma factor [Streptacidiphilus carbonis]|uniref:RNA polymerase sigma factor n=1 Tax=Streptacidiphilus carbonis TaxID=105422 RepID=UPI0005A90A9F|nr:RNA polymerase sigma factor [Streptacidiphilus carbonis]
MDNSIRAGVRAGDPAAFGQIFEEHGRAVYRYAVRVSGDWATAEDVVSLTFLEAWRLRSRVELDGGSLRPWLLGIATNVLRNTRRAARRHGNAVARLPPLAVVPDFVDELTGRLADAAQIAAAKAALQQLRPAEREVFALCVWEGLDHKAVAEALGKPVGTIRSRLSRARKRLRELTREQLADTVGAQGGGQRRPTRGQVTDDCASAATTLKETYR